MVRLGVKSQDSHIFDEIQMNPEKVVCFLGGFAHRTNCQSGVEKSHCSQMMSFCEDKRTARVSFY